MKNILVLWFVVGFFPGQATRWESCLERGTKTLKVPHDEAREIKTDVADIAGHQILYTSTPGYKRVTIWVYGISDATGEEIIEGRTVMFYKYFKFKKDCPLWPVIGAEVRAHFITNFPDVEVRLVEMD